LAAKFILLLGAGFSRNWGGWLASEAFEYLIGCPEIDGAIKRLLWKYKNKGGFESALAELQHEGKNSPGHQLDLLQQALRKMFADMDAAFRDINFEFQNFRENLIHREYTVSKFLTRFDAIFSLNQDLLLERHYLNENIALHSDGRWAGGQLVGVRPKHAISPLFESRLLGRQTPDPQRVIESNTQPYFKLHGSSNWFVSDTQDLLVMGANKSAAIAKYPVLKWINSQFESALSVPNTRIMVIGYSFSDEHINDVILSSVVNHQAELFIIDPLGVDVVNSNRDAAIPSLSDFAQQLQSSIVGASRRSMREIFGGDHAEHAKVMRFFKRS